MITIRYYSNVEYDFPLTDETTTTMINEQLIMEVGDWHIAPRTRIDYAHITMLNGWRYVVDRNQREDILREMKRTS